MLYQVTISTPDLSRFAALTVLLNNNGFGSEPASPTSEPRVMGAREIIEQPAVVQTKRAKKHVQETVAAIETATVAFDEAAYTKAGVADATMALNKAKGRDAVIGLLADFGQAGAAPSARGIPHSKWASYVSEAKKRAAVTESPVI